MEKLSSILFFWAGLVGIYAAYDFYSQKEYFSALGFLIGGLFFFYGSIINFINTNNLSLKPNKGKILKQTGRKIELPILNIEHLTNIRINMRAPYVIIAQGINPITNHVQIFKSYYIWDDILFLMQKKNTIDIYIDPNNPKKYYMDIEKLLYENLNVPKQNFIQQNSTQENFILDTKNMILEQDKGEIIKQKGIKVVAEIKNFKTIYETKIDNQNPFIIISEGINPITNQLQTFQSHFIIGDPNIIKDKKTIDIYINPENPLMYYPDITSIIKNPKSNNLNTKIDENSLALEEGILLKQNQSSKITLPIKTIEKIENFEMENKIFFSIKTEGVNPITNQFQNFETKIGILPEKENEIINKIKNQQIDIYIDQNNPKKYYIDLEPLKTMFENNL